MCNLPASGPPERNLLVVGSPLESFISGPCSLRMRTSAAANRKFGAGVEGEDKVVCAQSSTFLK